MRVEEKAQPFMLKVIGWSLALLLSLLALFGSVLMHGGKPDRKVASLLFAKDNAGFAEVTPGRSFSFPDDYATHEDFRQEWWYITANLQDRHGQRFGVQWTLFRSALDADGGEGWENSHVYMAHAVVTTANGVYAAERFSRGGIGQAGVRKAPFNVWLDNWQWKSRNASPFPAILSAADDDFGFSLHMDKVQPEVLQGDNGFSKKHATDNVASYYFSVPAIEMSGVIELEGERIEVSGLGWMDREWSTASLGAHQHGWDWFSVHLDDGRALMVVQVRSDDGLFRFGSLTSPDGTSKTLSTGEITMMPTSFAKMKNGRHLPTEWEISVPKAGIKLHSQPLHEQNWLDFTFPYWEGPIQLSGSNNGVGFMEATGY
ncbi:lipocalin-like domain-containing protein [Enterovibrio paralichthyis]|uniref:lipocalin-like domain-containing protein n=1 Tax=Enterovibrio paralichthyis TaxID=2853805 RepID=UPI00300C85E8